MTRGFATYELKVGPTRPPTDEYAERCNRQFQRLLSTDPSEREVQTFLQKHPWLVPGHRTPSGTSGHGPLHCSLIAQPKLPGRESFIPDFMWIAAHSGAWFPTLIEIERPGKKIFNRDGSTSAYFTKARNQLEHWRSWFNDPTNVQQFLELYGIPQSMRGRTRQLHMILIYGRRSEFEENPTLISRRGALLPGQDEELMSFDRLEADTSMRDAITVRAVGHGRFRALSVLPVFTTGPERADRLLHIEGVSEAINRNPEIDEDRRSFIQRRIGYWREWACSEGAKRYRVGDRE